MTAVRRPALSLAAIGLCLVSSLCGCDSAHSAGKSGAATGPARAAATASDTPAPAAPAGTGDSTMAAPSSAQLRAALPARPAGATPWPASYGPEGILTARQYVIYAGPDTSSELALQQHRGLLFGANWTWSEPDGEQVEILLARYSTPNGAESYYLNEQRSLTATYAKVTPYTLPGEAQSFGLPIATLNSFGDAVVRTNALAEDTVIVVNVNNPATPDTALADSVSDRILRALCTDQGCATS